MVGKYKVITLCGSTRFKEQFLEAQKRLTLEENIVISVDNLGISATMRLGRRGREREVDNGSGRFRCEHTC